MWKIYTWQKREVSASSLWQWCKSVCYRVMQVCEHSSESLIPTLERWAESLFPLFHPWNNHFWRRQASVSNLILWDLIVTETYVFIDGLFLPSELQHHVWHVEDKVLRAAHSPCKVFSGCWWWRVQQLDCWDWTWALREASFPLLPFLWRRLLITMMNYLQTVAVCACADVSTQMWLKKRTQRVC